MTQESIVNQIRHESRLLCPDYPGIQEDLHVFEHLRAITESLKGVRMACDDWYAVVNGFIDKGLITRDQLDEAFKERERSDL